MPIIRPMASVTPPQNRARSETTRSSVPFSRRRLIATTAACLAAAPGISAHRNEGSGAMTELQREVAGVSIACQPDRAGNRLVLPYVLTNASSELVYVMDATPKFDPATNKWSADRESVVV